MIDSKGQPLHVSGAGQVPKLLRRVLVQVPALIVLLIDGAQYGADIRAQGVIGL